MDIVDFTSLQMCVPIAMPILYSTWTQDTRRDTATVMITGVQPEVKTAVEVLSMHV